MNKKIFLTGMFSLVLTFAMLVIACPTDGGDSGSNGNSGNSGSSGGGGNSGGSGGGGGSSTIVTITAIPGVTAPVTDATMTTTITTDQYTGKITWFQGAPVATVALTQALSPATFLPGTQYTALITLTAKTGYTFEGFTEDFTVADANPVSIKGKYDAGKTIQVAATFPATKQVMTISAGSTILTVNWPLSDNLTLPTNYHVRYGKTSTVDASSPISSEISTVAGLNFETTITGLTNGLTYYVWVFNSNNTENYASVDPLYTGSAKPVGATKVTLAPNSHGTAGNKQITGLTSTAKYVVQEGDSWYPIEISNDLGTGGTLDAALATTVIDLAMIDNLNNNKTYNVFLVKEFTDNNSTLGKGDTSGKNTVAHIKALSANKTFTITGGGGTLIVFTDETNSTEISSGTSLAADQVIGSYYKITSVSNVTNIKIEASTSNKYATIDLSGGNDSTSITFTVQSPPSP